MSLADRFTALRRAARETLRQASARTGISASTLSRIERGEVTHLHDRTLARIACGYDVGVDFLLGEASPAARFEHHVRGLDARQRARLALDDQGRVHIALQFILDEAPEEVLSRLARALGKSIEELRGLCRSWGERVRAEPELAGSVTAALRRHAGIRPAWFHCGMLRPDSLALSRTLQRICSRAGVPYGEERTRALALLLLSSLDRPHDRN